MKLLRRKLETYWSKFTECEKYDTTIISFGQISTWKQEKIWPKAEMATRGKYGKITGKCHKMIGWQQLGSNNMKIWQNAKYILVGVSIKVILLNAPCQ